MGAQRSEILGLVMRDGMRLVVTGVAVGTAVALGLTRLLRSMLFGVEPSDPVTFGVVISLLALVALAACYVPARRAMQVDPMEALRYA